LSLAVKESEITWRKRPGLRAIDRLPVMGVGKRSDRITI
jgi:cytochrome P450 PksS